MNLKLRDCSACGNKVSPLAIACHRCGHPIARMKPSSVQGGIPSPKAISSKELHWSPMGSKSSQGPSSTYTINDIPLSQEAILQRIRHVFELSGFSVEQSKYQEGTATTIGGLIGAENGGLVGGITTIDKETWNPFLVSKAGHRFMQSKVTVLSTRQKSRVIHDSLSRTENDVELHVKIEAPNVPIWILITGMLLGMIIGFILNGRGDQGEFYGIIGVFLGAIPYVTINLTAWNATEVMNFQEQLTEAMLKIVPKLKL